MCGILPYLKNGLGISYSPRKNADFLSMWIVVGGVGFLAEFGLAYLVYWLRNMSLKTKRRSASGIHDDTRGSSDMVHTTQGSKNAGMTEKLSRLEEARAKRDTHGW